MHLAQSPCRNLVDFDKLLLTSILGYPGAISSFLVTGLFATYHSGKLRSSCSSFHVPDRPSKLLLQSFCLQCSSFQLIQLRLTLDLHHALPRHWAKWPPESLDLFTEIYMDAPSSGTSTTLPSQDTRPRRPSCRGWLAATGK